MICHVSYCSTWEKYAGNFNKIGPFELKITILKSSDFAWLILPPVANLCLILEIQAALLSSHPHFRCTHVLQEDNQSAEFMARLWSTPHIGSPPLVCVQIRWVFCFYFLLYCAQRKKETNKWRETKLCIFMLYLYFFSL